MTVFVPNRHRWQDHERHLRGWLQHRCSSDVHLGESERRGVPGGLQGCGARVRRHGNGADFRPLFGSGDHGIRKCSARGACLPWAGWTSRPCEWMCGECFVCVTLSQPEWTCGFVGKVLHAVIHPDWMCYGCVGDVCGSLLSLVYVWWMWGECLVLFSRRVDWECHSSVPDGQLHNYSVGISGFRRDQECHDCVFDLHSFDCAFLTLRCCVCWCDMSISVHVLDSPSVFLCAKVSEQLFPQLCVWLTVLWLCNPMIMYLVG